MNNYHIMRRRPLFVLFLILAVAQGKFTSEVVAEQAIELGCASVGQGEEREVLTPDGHGRDPLAANTPWFREFKRDISALPADPHSDEMLARMRKANGALQAEWSGSWTPAEWGWYTFPFQVVRGDTPLLAIPGAWAYNPAGNGPYMLPPEPVVYENSAKRAYATAKWNDNNDHHLCFYVRDEVSGGYKELWEYYQPWVTKTDGKITAVAGASWRRFDLAHGENPPPGAGSTDAAGLMISPLLVRYDEAAAGAILHALRFTVSNADISPTYKWPARSAAGAWNPNAGMPYGTRLRIKASWWNENADKVLGVHTQARIIGEAIRRYGIILADGSGGSSAQIQGVADQRWEKGLPERINAIPMTAMEVVETPPILVIEGPDHLKTGQQGKWKFTFSPADSPVGPGCNVNVYDQDEKLVQYALVNISEKQQMALGEYKFDKPGVYTIRPYEDWNTGFGRYKVTVE